MIEAISLLGALLYAIVALCMAWSPVHRILPATLRAALHSLGLGQHWGMFAAHVRHQGLYILRVHLASGEVLEYEHPLAGTSHPLLKGITRTKVRRLQGVLAGTAEGHALLAEAILERLELDEAASPIVRMQLIQRSAILAMDATPRALRYEVEPRDHVLLEFEQDAS
jgi:hypothetical protein